MKLDKYTFARLVAFISNTYAVTVHNDTMKDLDELIDIPEPEPEPLPSVKADDVDRLLRLMAEGTQKIEAIKIYRHLTGAYLKEGKEAVERYWVSKAPPLPDGNLKDIIGDKY